MRTTDERVQCIIERTEKKKNVMHQRQQRLARCGAFSLCFAFICFLSYKLSLPNELLEYMDNIDLYAASIVRRSNTVEYVIIGVIAFALGVFTEILLSKLSTRSKKNRGRNEEDRR
ncbi:MAG: hypothetical protein PUB87_05845 [Eubacteriaceae bacterium]|nr:hypothetical protein [Eubacteriaceae bacterium]